VDNLEARIKAALCVRAALNRGPIEGAHFRTFLDPSWRPTAAQSSSRARRGVLVDANRRTVARPAGGIRRLELDTSAVSAVGRQRRLAIRDATAKPFVGISSVMAAMNSNPGKPRCGRHYARATTSSASSIGPRTHIASPPDATSSSRALRPSCSLRPFASGSGFSPRLEGHFETCK
jgi:hypothetical protein